MVIDVTEPERGVLPEGVVSVEARFGGLFQENLLRKGGHRRAVDTSPARTHRARGGEWREDRTGWSGVGKGASGASARIIREVDVQRGPLARNGRRIAVRGRPVPHCLRRPEHRGGDGDSMVCRSGKARTARTNGVHREHRGHGYGTAITWPRRLPCDNWARPAPLCAPGVPTSAPSPPIGRLDSNSSLTFRPAPRRLMPRAG